jgi:hypothetical protein
LRSVRAVGRSVSGRLFGCTGFGGLGCAEGGRFGCGGLAAPGRSFGTGGLFGRLDGESVGGVTAESPGFAALGWFDGWLFERAMVGVAGLPGGACLTIGCAAAVAAGRKLCTSRFPKGCPGCAAKACSCFAKGTGGGGGVAFAITCRFITAGGGVVTWLAVAALAPSTLSRVGTTATRVVRGAAAICRAFMAIAARATGCAVAKERRGTAVTAPCTFLFT